MTSAKGRLLSLLVGPLALGVFAACFSGTGPALLPEGDAGGGSIDLSGDAGFVRSDADIGDPFAIVGLTPSHGPFNGGTRTRIDGRGFSPSLRVFIAGVEVEAGSLLASDPNRAAIVTPPGPPGFVDVMIRDEATAKERVLKNGFYYDAFVLVPDSGATSGGTRVALTGSGTAWATGTTVTIGGVACKDVVVTSPTKLECVTPVGTPGSKDVVVTPLGAPPIQARDAFTYSDSVDGYRGGLSGGALSGRVKVLAYNLLVGAPIPGAFAIAGDDLATAKVAKTTANGVIEIDGITGDKVTVTVAAKCHQPVTFVDVPVDTVTAYLAPVLDPSCGEGDPVSIPPRQRYGGFIEGQLVFPGAGEFERVGWTTVPLPTKPTERRAAYVFEAAPAPNQAFTLPPASSAITPSTAGSTGYDYSILVFPGNSTIYVVAGIEDRSETPPKFVPYSMGVARGVAVPAQSRVQGVDIKMDVLFDHQVTVAAEPPTPAPRGPDRFTASISMTLGAAGYAILPRGTRAAALPAPPTIPFIGVPSLDKAMTGEQYVLGGVAATGPEQRLPASVVARVRTTNANTPVSLGGFLGVPVLGEPGSGVWGGTHVDFGGATGPADLSVMNVVSGGGLVTWTIVAPGGKTSFDVPDLAALPGPDPVGLVPGAISTTVYVARIEQFQYGRLRYGQLSTGPWSAYAFDNLGGVY
ncbi:MAG: IPT/TIG domain-containing protein [Labilithrix sp.]|nr:IPT/TIG domain-containing protein [Labilithrix sp.]MBX3224162.1 IPT/TIG domain-containing protein [Labilithrix sp.]